MSDAPQTPPPGLYYAEGDPPGTQRYWNGQQWEGEPQAIPGAPQAMAPGAVPPAEPLNRIAARIIDIILWFIVGSILQSVVAGANAFNQGALSDVSFGRAALASLIGTAAVSAYEILMVANRGATLGKMALGLKVVKDDGTTPADMNDAVRRMIIYIALGVFGALFATSVGLSSLLGLVTIVVGLVSLVFLFTDDKRQAVWDKVANTMVISSK